MANVACLICDSPEIIKPENETNEEGPESGIQTEGGSDRNASRSEVFHIFCQQMGVDQNSQPWNSDSDGPPFCPPCRQTVTQVFDLKSQLQRIQNDLNGILHTVRQKVQSTIDGTTKFDDVDQIDERIVNLRYAMIGRKLFKSDDESNQVTSEHLSGTESVNAEGDGPEVVSLTESDSSSSHSDWSSSKVRRNKRNHPKRSRRKARGADCKDDEDNDEVVEISGESSDSDAGADEYVPSTKKKRKCNSDSNNGHSDDQILETYADGATLEYYGFRFQSVSGEFKCLECPESTFADKGQLFAHIREKHLGRTAGYYCSICGKHCDSPSGLRTHETSHSDVRDWVCCKCGKGFKNEKNLKRHMKETHKLDLQLRCFLCLQEFKSQLDMKSHLKTEHMDDMSRAGKSKYCDSCGKTFKSEEIRQQHLKVHQDEKFFKCHYCEKLYLQKDNIKVHFAKDHGVGV